MATLHTGSIQPSLPDLHQSTVRTKEVKQSIIKGLFTDLVNKYIHSLFPHTVIRRTIPPLVFYNYIHYNVTCIPPTQCTECCCHGNRAQCDVQYIYLHLTVDICLCCNQTFNYWKMSLPAGDMQWCRTSLEVKNSSEVAP